MRIIAACLLSLALLPACSTRSSYLVNRGADLADILRGHFMFGPGVAAKVEATRLLHVGGTYTHNVFAWGLHNREVGPWRESVQSWGLIVGYHYEEVDGIERVSGSYGWSFDEKDAGGAFRPAGDRGLLDLDLLTFRGTLMVIVGIDLEVRLGEVVDFLAGIFQFDPAGDDMDYENLREPRLGEEVEEAGAGGSTTS